MKSALCASIVALFVTTASLWAPTAHAESPERVAVELAVGPYAPNGNRQQFDLYFPGDRGPVFGLEANFYIVRIPYVGPLGIAASGAWARYSGHACEDVACATPSSESVRFDLFPLALTASLRLDVLQRQFRVPIFIQGNIGLEYVRFRSTRGGGRDTYGGAFGMRWQAQVGLYLDMFEPRAARALDEQHGINHTYLFFQLRGSTATAVFPVADRFTWLGGLGLVF